MDRQRSYRLINKLLFVRVLGEQDCDWLWFVGKVSWKLVLYSCILWREETQLTLSSRGCCYLCCSNVGKTCHVWLFSQKNYWKKRESNWHYIDVSFFFPRVWEMQIEIGGISCWGEVLHTVRCICRRCFCSFCSKSCKRYYCRKMKMFELRNVCRTYRWQLEEANGTYVSLRVRQKLRCREMQE